MIHNTRIPAPLQRKMLLTSVIGVACFLIGFAFFLFCKDQTMLLLSLAVFVMCIGKTITLYRIVSMQSYETVEGTCAFIAPQFLRRYRKVKIIDSEGNETSLLLDKYSQGFRESGLKYIQAFWDDVNVFVIEVEHITGKKGTP